MVYIKPPKVVEVKNRGTSITQFCVEFCQNSSGNWTWLRTNLHYTKELAEKEFLRHVQVNKAVIEN